MRTGVILLVVLLLPGCASGILFFPDPPCPPSPVPDAGEETGAPLVQTPPPDPGAGGKVPERVCGCPPGQEPKPR